MSFGDNGFVSTTSYPYPLSTATWNGPICYRCGAMYLGAHACLNPATSGYVTTTNVIPVVSVKVHPGRPKSRRR